MVGSAKRHEIIQDRLEDVDRYYHVEGFGAPAVTDLLHLQRADAQKRTVAANHGRSSPKRMRRCGKDGLVEHVFPIAGELLLGCDASYDRMSASTGARDHDWIADFCLPGASDGQCRQ